jgi:RNA polymerase sigma factor (sigma-70 family)
MAASRMDPIIQHLHNAVLHHNAKARTDGELLDSYLANGDGAAFEALVRRHGPMVLGVCRRVLGNPHDADDAFQATFLVLARKAATVLPRELVGNWLYGVAHTTAIRAKSLAAKRRMHERPLMDSPEPQAAQSEWWENLQPVLDREIARLPDKYRQVVVLCDLEGRARKPVARQLKIPEGTLSSRLTTARRMLAKRLARHGLGVSGATLASVIPQSAASAFVPAYLMQSAVRAAILVAAGQALAAGPISAKVTALTEGVLKAMFLTKLKTMTGLLLVLGMVAGGAGLLTQYPTPAQAHTGNAKPTQTQAEPPRAETKFEQVTLGQGAASYNATFNRVLDVLGSYFEIAEANRYEGRIEASPDITAAANGPKVRRRAVAQITADECGGFWIWIQVLVYKDAERKPTPQKDAVEPESSDRRWQPVGRDHDLEQVILARLAAQAEPNTSTNGKKPAQDSKRAEATSIQGVWQLQSIEVGGSLQPMEKGSTQLVITNEFLIRAEHGKDRAFTYKLDAGHNPKHIDLAPVGKGAPAKVAAIYWIEGDRLKICESKGARPTEFATTLGSGFTLSTYKRTNATATQTKDVADPAAWANKLFDQTSIDFGECQHGEQLKHKFKMTNIYAVPMEITQVRSSCGCMTCAVSHKTLTPGESGDLEVSVDTRRFVGAKTMSIYVSVGTQYTSTATLTVKVSN